MSKSVYYSIPWNQQKRVKQFLSNLGVSFSFMSLEGEAVVVLLDVPAEKLSSIRNVFGYDGKVYQPQTLQ